MGISPLGFCDLSEGDTRYSLRRPRRRTRRGRLWRRGGGWSTRSSHPPPALQRDPSESDNIRYMAAETVTAAHLTLLPVRFDFAGRLHQEDDAEQTTDLPREFRGVFATLDPDDLAASLSECFMCYFKSLLYPSGFTNGAGMPFKISHWSDENELPIGAGYIESSETEAALRGTFANSPGARDAAARLLELVTYGVGELSVGASYLTTREGDALTEAEREAGVDVAVDLADGRHLAYAERGGHPNTSLELFTASYADCPPRATGTACSLAEAAGEVDLIRGEIVRARRGLRIGSR